ncbi:hypothetical protein RRG08_053179 [Elysia crispata]|uniref:Uncharacterized protein n=1 Tax=Elysia crispata TaxID=231223 RepID=A0AAE0YRE2_9GAST|nr:hypothetical protein RRG08_053179 [Elysia crispata]
MLTHRLAAGRTPPFPPAAVTVHSTMLAALSSISLGREDLQSWHRDALFTARQGPSPIGCQDFVLKMSVDLKVKDLVSKRCLASRSPIIRPADSLAVSLSTGMNDEASVLCSLSTRPGRGLWY